MGHELKVNNLMDQICLYSILKHNKIEAVLRERSWQLNQDSKLIWHVWRDKYGSVHYDLCSQMIE